MTSYEEIIESAKRLSSAERVQLADALLAEELGFGMWRAATRLRTGRPTCPICAMPICARLTAARKLLRSFVTRYANAQWAVIKYSQ
jgi:hypothetical protein